MRITIYKKYKKMFVWSSTNALLNNFCSKENNNIKNNNNPFLFNCPLKDTGLISSLLLFQGSLLHRDQHHEDDAILVAKQMQRIPGLTV